MERFWVGPSLSSILVRLGAGGRGGLTKVPPSWNKEGWTKGLAPKGLSNPINRFTMGRTILASWEGIFLVLKLEKRFLFPLLIPHMASLVTLAKERMYAAFPFWSLTLGLFFLVQTLASWDLVLLLLWGVSITVDPILSSCSSCIFLLFHLLNRVCFLCILKIRPFLPRNHHPIPMRIFHIRRCHLFMSLFIPAYVDLLGWLSSYRVLRHPLRGRHIWLFIISGSMPITPTFGGYDM